MTDEVLHLKGEHMSFSPFNRVSSVASICKLIGPEISKTLQAGVYTRNGRANEVTMEFDEAIIVLDGIVRILTGEGYRRVIEAKFGDVVWLPKGARVNFSNVRRPSLNKGNCNGSAARDAGDWQFDQ